MLISPEPRKKHIVERKTPSESGIDGVGNHLVFDVPAAPIPVEMVKHDGEQVQIEAPWGGEQRLDSGGYLVW